MLERVVITTELEKPIFLKKFLSERFYKFRPKVALPAQLMNAKCFIRKQLPFYNSARQISYSFSSSEMQLKNIYPIHQFYKNFLLASITFHTLKLNQTITVLILLWM